MLLGQSLFVPRNSGEHPVTLSQICDCFRYTVIPQIETYVGLGNTHDLANILSQEIAQKTILAEIISDELITGFIKTTSASQEASDD